MAGTSFGSSHGVWPSEPKRSPNYWEGETKNVGFAFFSLTMRVDRIEIIYEAEGLAPRRHPLRQLRQDIPLRGCHRCDSHFLALMINEPKVRLDHLKQLESTRLEGSQMKYIVTRMDIGANLRTIASDQAGLLGNLQFATTLQEVAPSATKWKQVKVLDGPFAGKSGFVSDRNLTVLHSDASGRLIQAAAFYWDEFARGQGKEADDEHGASPLGASYKQKVLTMWDALGGGRPPGNNTSHPDWPWSAAGMSAFVRRAGDYAGFKFSAGHHAYIKHAVAQRENNKSAGPFWGFRLTEHKPRIGDLMVRWRGDVKTYEQVKAIMSTNRTFKAHTDVVCEIGPGSLWALGANNGNSVARRSYALDTDGFVQLTGDRFMIMKNML